MKEKIFEKCKKYITPSLLLVGIICIFAVDGVSADAKYASVSENEMLTMIRTAEDNKYKSERSEAIQNEMEANKIVYDGLTMVQLVAKLNKNLGSTLTGKGQLFAEYSLQKGIDPYLVVAIVLHETGCKYGCSGLTKKCNNVGGQKGTPSCGGTSYRSYPTIDEGIKGMIDNLYNNYYSQGLKTPEQINPKYAESTVWATRINSYISTIKAS